jgi:molybdenum cofactor cytidylyltransferase
MNLVQAIRLTGNEAVALVGSGGKTTALFQLARQLKPPVIVSTTTHLGIQQARFADLHFIVRTVDDLNDLENSISSDVILVTGDPTQESRLAGLPADLMKKLFSITKEKNIPLLIEADGSRQKPLKAPSNHEPVVPDFVSIVVLFAGLSGLGKPLTAEWVHRPESFEHISGLRLGETITSEALARVLVSPVGGLKGIPENCRRIIILNQADSIEVQAQAQKMSSNLLDYYAAVCVASLEPSNDQRTSGRADENLNPTIFAVHEHVAGIVLAGGGSTRFGKPKQILTWRGKTFIQQVVSTALVAGLSPLILVTGANHDQIIKLVGEEVKQVIHNPEWESGQSTSVRAGLSALDPNVGGAVFLLADQPQIPATLIRALVDLHASTLAPIVAPMVNDQRANPVLFDRATFPDFVDLRGDQGGRALFARNPVLWLEWLDESILLDVDSPEDYQRLLSLT